MIRIMIIIIMMMIIIMLIIIIIIIIMMIIIIMWIVKKINDLVRMRLNREIIVQGDGKIIIIYFYIL